MAVAFVLALIGVLVVARVQIFLGAAVAQATTFGIALAIRCEDSVLLAPLMAFGAELTHTMMGGLTAIASAILTSRGGHGRESAEALTGWVFLAASSVAVLLVANSAHGLAEVQGLLASTIIGADTADATALAAIALVTVFVFAARADEILLFVTDAEMARAVGVSVGRWNHILAVWLGMTLALAIHVAGTIYAFGCLVLPGLVARNLCRDVRGMLVAAPLIGLTSALVAFVVANHYDWPPGQTAVALLSMSLAATWIWRATRTVQGIPVISRGKSGGIATGSSAR
jgi:ABC-type Mn2+/Zn2+ transport system permease subunit